ncbi:acetoacetate decarboxylase [Mesorhizobium sp. BAC0120]|uniref:acetoacetate decarboxylase n=1 Tax=Mesorhizobium sp. BAC0120 TaxID=3090670 RepID=UPI00298D57F3|nr:acetoacetate decarboxylase [Mesorhizobium sp. BAC0120]MDW6022346.1 acetoacetate decarboxylase [Mesorhizobium sp. BAC0120]
MAEQRHGLTRPTIDDILKSGFSTPWDAPTVPPFPFRFRNAEILTLFYRTDADAMRFLLPPPLEAQGDVAAIHIYRMNDTDWLGPYFESNVMFGARMPGGPQGGYSPYLFLGSDAGVSHGREVHGQPKKFAQPKLEFRGDLIVGTVSRNGIDVITGTMAYKQLAADPAVLRRHFDVSVNLNLKVIDHIDGRPAIRQITSRKLADVTVHECWEGPCTVELRPNAQAPVYRLPVLEALTGCFWRADFTLVPGEIVHDYLMDTAR